LPLPTNNEEGEPEAENVTNTSSTEQPLANGIAEPTTLEKVIKAYLY